MQITVNQKSNGATLTLLFKVVGSGGELTEPPIIVNGVAIICFKFRCAPPAGGGIFTLYPSIVLKKLKTKSSTVKLNVTCENVEKEWICTDDWTEYQLPSKERDFFYDGMYTCSLEVNLTVPERPVPMQSQLYEDTEFTDFQLRAADGAVAVHKCVMAIHSDVFKKMVTGEWKETTEGCINLAGLTVRSLQHLKDYMYKGTLPDEDDELEMLLLVGDCYMIEDMKAGCIRKLTETVTSANIDKLVEFACQENMPDLVQALLYQVPHRIQNGLFKLEAKNDKESN